eukprot:scaffold95825_cov40-Cyclotella_meneghiniana.AAC.1
MSNHCASCGKADANLKACKACMLVKYCSVECQVAHRPAHKKACRFCLPREHCPFCNTPAARGDEETIKRLSDRIEKYNDLHAMIMMSAFYRLGWHGLPVDKSKEIELLQRACELGSAAAHHNVGTKYQNGNGTEIDMKKAVHHYQIAAMMGNMLARHNLGYAGLENKNYPRAMRHFMIAAESGLKDSLDMVKQGFTQGDVTKQDFEKTLRDHQASCDETKSEQRERAAVIQSRNVE